MIKINIESDPKFKKPNDSVIFSLISYVMEQQKISDADLLFIFGVKMAKLLKVLLLNWVELCV